MEKISLHLNVNEIVYLAKMLIYLFFFSYFLFSCPASDGPLFTEFVGAVIEPMDINNIPREVCFCLFIMFMFAAD